MTQQALWDSLTERSDDDWVIITKEEFDSCLDAYAAQRVAEAIERCAQIAEDRALTVAGHEAGVIACLIRYLKEPGR